MPFIFWFFLAHWYFSLFTLTFLQHRYAAHGVFRMSKTWERFFYLLAYIAQGSAYVSPRTFAILHRMHHAYTDTEKDPHSPLYDKNIFTLMWNTRAISTAVFRGKFKPEERFMKNLPDWPALDKWAHSWMSRVLWGIIYILIYVFFAPSAWWFLLLPFHILNVPFHAVIINWFAHKYGSVNYKMKNTSKNLWPFDFIMLGEAYHNNHHKHPSSANMGKRWYEIDPVYPVLLFLNWVRVIRINREHTGYKKMEVKSDQEA
ncbi:MAG TPA: acyl-CoA desaturase [Chitinophagaceae bacterium]|jgi:stearoyl-CoA desaturase (delta-9 desaturase)|nr:acyl-CoA desaturase [Chitinophagaceae bacterium]